VRLKARLVLCFFGSGLIGVGLKLSTFLDKVVFFPFFPNVLDFTFIVVSGVIFLALAFKGMVKR